MQVTNQQPKTTKMPNLQQLNNLANEVAQGLGTIDVELLQKVHDLVIGTSSETLTGDTAAAAITDTLTAVS